MIDYHRLLDKRVMEINGRNRTQKHKMHQQFLISIPMSIELSLQHLN